MALRQAGYDLGACENGAKIDGEAIVAALQAQVIAILQVSTLLSCQVVRKQHERVFNVLEHACSAVQSTRILITATLTSSCSTCSHFAKHWGQACWTVVGVRRSSSVRCPRARPALSA